MKNSNNASCCNLKIENYALFSFQHVFVSLAEIQIKREEDTTDRPFSKVNSFVVFLLLKMSSREPLHLLVLSCRYFVTKNWKGTLVYCESSIEPLSIDSPL